METYGITKLICANCKTDIEKCDQCKFYLNKSLIICTPNGHFCSSLCESHWTQDENKRVLKELNELGDL